MPRKGHGSVGLSYQYVDASRHLYSGDVTGRTFTGGYVGEGKSARLGDVRAQSAALEVEYGLHPRLAVGGNVAFVASKYTGRAGHPALPGRPMIDDGLYHPTFQDASAGLRFLASRRPVAVLPYFRFGFPTHDYVDVGHSAVGRHLRHLQLGVTVGRRLDPVLADAYVKGTVAYSFVQRAHAETPTGVHIAEIEALNINRRHFSLEAGYLVSPRLTLALFGSYLHTEDGIDSLRDLVTPEDRARLGHAHDAAAAARHGTVGGSVGFAPRRGTWVYAALSATPWGENTHAGYAITLGVSRALRLPSRRPSAETGRR